MGQDHQGRWRQGRCVTKQAPTRPLPLAGVRVLDISQVMAGPYACMLLADLGADVIKIEPPGAGDQTRGAMGFKMKGADSLGFLNMNRNKRSVTLNLKSQAGREVLLRMAKDADILLENYRPGAMKRLGLSTPGLSSSIWSLLTRSGQASRAPRTTRRPRSSGVSRVILRASASLFGSLSPVISAGAHRSTWWGRATAPRVARA